jgi:CRP-like cAMP-binding protein
MTSRVALPRTSSGRLATTGAPARPPQNANRILAALQSEGVARLRPHLESVQLEAGAVLYEPGSRVGYAYFPDSCVISVLVVMEDGNSAEVALFGCEGVLGYSTSMGSCESFGRCVVQLSGSASRVSVDILRTEADANPILRALLARYAEALLIQTFQYVACNALHSVDARCCRWILSMQDRVNGATLPITHEFLAEMLGVQRSTVSVITRTLQSRGLIKQHRGGISICDRKALESRCCECYSAVRRTFERLLPNT